MELAPVSDLLDTAASADAAVGGAVSARTAGADTAADPVVGADPAGGTVSGAGGAVSGVVHVEVVDVAALCDEGLWLRLGVLGRAESRLAAMKAQVLAEVGRRQQH